MRSALLILLVAVIAVTAGVWTVTRAMVSEPVDSVADQLRSSSRLESMGYPRWTFESRLDDGFFCIMQGSSPPPEKEWFACVREHRYTPRRPGSEEIQQP
jgi:hypothetical protein